MIRVTVQLISAIDPSRSRELGRIDIANDGTGGIETGNYTGTLFAEYCRSGRHAEIKNFRRNKQSVFTLIGAFLKKWGHTSHKEGLAHPVPPVTMQDPMF